MVKYYRLDTSFTFAFEGPNPPDRTTLEDAVIDVLIDLAESNDGSVGGSCGLVEVNEDGEPLNKKVRPRPYDPMVRGSR